MNNTSVEAAIGAVVIVVAAAFFVFLYLTSGGAAVRDGYTLTAEFDNVAGVNTGTDVRLAGIKIGTVTGQSLDPQNYQARIVMAIDRAVKLSEDSTARITSEGLLGSTFVALEPGGSDAMLANGGQIANTQGAVDIWTLVSQAMFESGKGKDKGGDEAAKPPGEAAPPAQQQ
jgi:phospholipid/cholesterol/gamma-HCH transport system substrate-binding protein